MNRTDQYAKKYAAMDEDLEMYELLISQGAQADARDGNGLSAEDNYNGLPLNYYETNLRNQRNNGAYQQANNFNRNPNIFTIVYVNEPNRSICKGDSSKNSRLHSCMQQRISWKCAFSQGAQADASRRAVAYNGPR